MNEQSSLKACPFCGSAPNSVKQSVPEHGNDGVVQAFVIRCENPTCWRPVLGRCEHGDKRYDAVRAEAITAWNTRTDTALREQRDELLEALERAERCLERMGCSGIEEPRKSARAAIAKARSTNTEGE